MQHASYAYLLDELDIRPSERCLLSLQEFNKTLKFECLNFENEDWRLIHFRRSAALSPELLVHVNSEALRSLT